MRPWHRCSAFPLYLLFWLGRRIFTKKDFHKRGRIMASCFHTTGSPREAPTYSCPASLYSRLCYHRSPNESDVRERFFSVREWEQYNHSSPSTRLSPRALRDSQFLSFMNSFTEYSLGIQTLISSLSEDAIDHTWNRVCYFLNEYWFQVCPLSFARSGFGIAGAFVGYQSKGKYTIGIVMKTHHSDSESTRENTQILLSLQQFAGFLLSSHPEPLPIGSGLREVKLSMWWPTSDQRVTPGSSIPPLRVIVSKPARLAYDLLPSPSASSPDSSILFRGYKAVNTFLISPLSSRMGGSTCCPMPRFPDSNLRELITSPGECGTVQYDSHILLRKEGDKVKADFYFSDLTVHSVGEHLIGVELLVSEAYKPFVPSLTTYLKPFLVVCG